MTNQRAVLMLVEHSLCINRPSDTSTVNVRQMLQELQFKRIVRLYAAGTDANGATHICLELCPYGDLGSFLASSKLCIQLGESGEEPTVMQTLTWGMHLCEALAHVHRKRSVHNDVKLENVVLARDKTAKLTDFGTSGVLKTATNALPVRWSLLCMAALVDVA